MKHFCLSTLSDYLKELREEEGSHTDTKHLMITQTHAELKHVSSREILIFSTGRKCYSYQILFQLRFKSWPDRGMPSTPNDLIELGVDQNLILIINTL